VIVVLIWERAEEVRIEEFIGQRFTEVKVVTNNEDNNTIWFYTKDKVYKMTHEQDCCEDVYIESIVGKLEDLIGSPITMAEVVTEEGENDGGTYTWSFYKLATTHGYVTIRWNGESNGYYSEEVSITKNERE
jgi:hypothetical protein